jgi:hypothetical protein
LAVIFIGAVGVFQPGGWGLAMFQI